MARLVGEITGPASNEVHLSGTVDHIVVPNAEALFQGVYSQHASDLVIEGPDGTLVRIIDYFSSDESPNLYSEQGAVLTGDVVGRLVGAQNPGLFAQSGTQVTSGQDQIGQVETLEGNAFATRANGQRIALNIGDPVFQDDLIETTDDSRLGLTFIDETVFSLSANARMILDELVYEPGGSDNSMVMNLVQGTFVFITGQVAPTGDMVIETPVATMGIRGTTPIVMIDGQNGNTQFGILKDPDGEIGQYDLFDKITGARIQRIVSEDSVVQLDRVGGDPVETTIDAAGLAERAEAQSNAYFLYSAARSRLDAPQQQDNTTPDDAPDGDRSQLDPGETANPIDLASSGLDGFSIENVDLSEPDTEDPSDTSSGEFGSDQDFLPPDGFFDIFDLGLFVDTNIPPIAENLTFALDEKTFIAEGDLVASDPDGDPIVFYDILDQPEFGFVLNNEDGTFTFIADPIFETLAEGEVGSVSFSYQAVDLFGGVSNAATVTIQVFGSNDAPFATPILADAVTDGDLLTSIDLLETAFDLDYTDKLSTQNVTATSSAVGRTVGFWVDNNTGEFQFDPEQFADLLVGESETITIEYDITDPFGATVQNFAQITVQGTNNGPFAADDGLSGEFVVESGDSINIVFGALLANDFDPEGDAFDITSVFGASNGTVNLGPSATIDFTTDSGLNTGDVATFFYEVTDSFGAAGFASVDIIIDNTMGP